MIGWHWTSQCCLWCVLQKKVLLTLLVLSGGSGFAAIGIFTKAYEHNTCTWAQVIIKIIRSIWGGGSMMVFIINISNLLSPTALFLPISKLRLSKMLMTSKETRGHEKEYQQKRVLLRPQRENKEVNIQEIEPWKIKDYMLSHCWEWAVQYLVSFSEFKYLKNPTLSMNDPQTIVRYHSHT